MKRLCFPAFLLALALLPGCAAAETPCRRELLAMDTVMALTAYGPNGADAVRRGGELLEELDGLLSVTEEASALSRANRAGGEPVEVPDPVRELLAEALSLCGETEGALDVTVYPAVRAWGFTTGEYRVPGEEELAALLERVDCSRVTLEGNVLTLPEGMELDLGAVAKGWAGDRLMELFAACGVTSAIVELGGNVQALGAKPDGSPWRVAVRAPEGGYAGALELVNQAAVTSGGYQRYFERDGETYCHILDPATLRPVRNGVASVTVVTDRGAAGDGLSTALFVMGREGAEDFWRTRRDFDFLLLMEDGTAAVTEGLEGRFALCGEWEGRELEVLRR